MPTRASNRFKARRAQPGQSPGTLTYVGKATPGAVKISITDYDADHFERTEVTTLEACARLRPSTRVEWIDVDGISNPEVVATLGRIFGLHALLLEDVMNTEQKPKVEYYENCIFVVMKMLTYNKTSQSIAIEQVSFVLGASFVITFQEEREADVFDPVRVRLNQAPSRIRKFGPDYLFYALADTIVDNYFVVLEHLGERIEDLEEAIITRSDNALLREIYAQKRDLIFMRRATWPVRELLSTLVRDENPLVARETQVFLRDVYDHTIQVIDTVESYRDLMASLLDIYLSAVSNRLNSVMKLLTIVSTIFMPLSFIVGVYGMNFEFMPELKWRYGYAGVWGVILTVLGFMLYYFRRKKWL